MRSSILAGWLAGLGMLILDCSPISALIGADLADVTVQRYTVAVGSAKGICSGAVLAQDLVLTAAHCVEDAGNLWVGGNRGWGAPTDPPVMLSPVARAVTHPDFARGRYGAPDLALLKLTSPLPDRFTPVFIDPRPAGHDSNLIAAGYGKNAENDSGAGRVLRMVLLRTERAGNDYLTLASTQANPRTGGPGDSGSPVFTYRGMHALAGIIVTGTPTLAMAIPIAPNYRWIREMMDSLDALQDEP